MAVIMLRTVLSGYLGHRTVLSEIARLFDPYGLVGPVVVQGKLFLQELWKAKYSWDEPLSDELQSRWMEFRTNLCELDAVSVPRWVSFGMTILCTNGDDSHVSILAWVDCCHAAQLPFEGWTLPLRRSQAGQRALSLLDGLLTEWRISHPIVNGSATGWPRYIE